MSRCAAISAILAVTVLLACSPDAPEPAPDAPSTPAPAPVWPLGDRTFGVTLDGKVWALTRDGDTWRSSGPLDRWTDRGDEPDWSHCEHWLAQTGTASAWLREDGKIAWQSGDAVEILDPTALLRDEESVHAIEFANGLLFAGTTKGRVLAAELGNKWRALSVRVPQEKPIDFFIRAGNFLFAVDDVVVPRYYYAIDLAVSPPVVNGVGDLPDRTYATVLAGCAPGVNRVAFITSTFGQLGSAILIDFATVQARGHLEFDSTYRLLDTRGRDRGDGVGSISSREDFYVMERRCIHMGALDGAIAIADGDRGVRIVYGEANEVVVAVGGHCADVLVDAPRNVIWALVPGDETRLVRVDWDPKAHVATRGAAVLLDHAFVNVMQ